uniref:Uncharacterized protein n=1 Tax=Acrobeloides nanus TaxID=290746 RepID=A0A914DAJ5_9BILA
IQQLGGVPVDYNSPNAKDEIIEHGPFDVILDCVDTELSRWSDNVLGVWRNCVHVSIVSPLLQDTDRYGVFFGVASTLLKSALRIYEPAIRGRIFTYAFFMPNSECLHQISRFIDEGKIKPIVEKVFPFSELPEAYEKVAKLRGVGKTVIDFSLTKSPQKDTATDNNIVP